MQELILELLDTTNTIGDVCDELEIVDTTEVIEEVYAQIDQCDCCGLWTRLEDLEEGWCIRCLEDLDDYFEDCDE